MADIRSLDPSIRPAAEILIETARRAGFAVRVTSARRSLATQRRLYRRWKLGLSKYPAAVPGTSKHERGLAFDLSHSDPQVLQALGQMWEEMGGRWGGRFNDPIHFEA